MKPPINPEPVNPDWTVKEREQETADLQRAIEAKAAEKGCKPPADKLVISIIK